MGTRINDDHHQPQPGDMNQTERIMEAFRILAASYRPQLPPDDDAEDGETGDAPAPPSA